jgi:hypothetical protein
MPTKFHKNLPVASKVDGGDGQTDRHRQDVDLVAYFHFWKVG